MKMRKPDLLDLKLIGVGASFAMIGVLGLANGVVNDVNVMGAKTSAYGDAINHSHTPGLGDTLFASNALIGLDMASSFAALALSTACLAYGRRPEGGLLDNYVTIPAPANDALNPLTSQG